MLHRQLGRNGPRVSALGLGCMAMTNLYGPVDEVEAVATIREALDAGSNFLDTADAYADGKNEELLRRALADGYRDKAFVATKFGNVRSADGKPAANGRPDYVIEACERSLARLGVETIDLYYQHRVDANVPIEETVGAMARLVKQGKVRHLGLSEAGATTLRRAHAVHPIAALQTEYSLWCRFIEHDVLPVCRELGIGFVPYSPLGRGMLTGAIADLSALGESDRRRDHPRFKPGNIEQNAALVAPLVAMANEKECTPGQLALAWLLAQGDDIVPIPGTKQRAHLRQNLAALDIALDRAEILALARAIDDTRVQGARYPNAQLSLLGL
ncbi:MAG: aldo/keto reductase [Betaproteobacteria bacterium]|nr:aldo/keto reductase [Betaproteobacteria bacterium]